MPSLQQDLNANHKIIFWHVERTGPTRDTGPTSHGDCRQFQGANPKAVIAVERAWLAHETAPYAEETERLEAVNATILAEAALGDPYVRRIRPTFGYVMAATWRVMMAAIAWTAVTAPNDTATAITAFASLSTIWSVGLAVLGVYVYKRSDEKTGKAAQPGLMAALSRRLGGG